MENQRAEAEAKRQENARKVEDAIELIEAQQEKARRSIRPLPKRPSTSSQPGPSATPLSYGSMALDGTPPFGAEPTPRVQQPSSTQEATRALEDSLRRKLQSRLEARLSAREAADSHDTDTDLDDMES